MENGYNLKSKVYAIIQNSGTTGSGGAVGTITVDNGTITNITVGASGSNYSGATLILYDPTNTPTEEAVVTVSITESKTISQFVINDGGAGYSNDVIGFVIPGTARCCCW